MIIGLATRPVCCCEIFARNSLFFKTKRPMHRGLIFLEEVYLTGQVSWGIIESKTKPTNLFLVLSRDFISNCKGAARSG